jgi:hypothetical protein
MLLVCQPLRGNALRRGERPMKYSALSPFTLGPAMMLPPYRHRSAGQCDDAHGDRIDRFGADQFFH